MAGVSDLIAKISGAFAFGGSGSAVGLSVGTSSVKIVELVKNRKSWKLVHFGMIQLPEDAIVNREIVNHIAVVESIKTLVNQLRLKSKQVCTSLSGTSVIVKRMGVEVQNARELQDQVFWEAEQYLPFDVSEVVMDYEVLSKSKDKQADIMLVAVKKTVLDSYMTCVDDSGLKPKIVDVDFFALQNLFEANYPPKPTEAVAIVDIGASSTKIVVVHNNIPVFTKDTAIGGKNLTAEIQKHLNLSFEDAETLKVGGQTTGMPQEVSELMHISAENFASEIKRALDFYDASSSGAPVTYVLLAGGGAKMRDLSRTVEEAVGLPTQIINPFNAISYDPSVFTQDYISAIAPVAAIPIGLALRMGAGAK
ncbi:MAG: type IV pilus assembly protein PilM [Bacteriovoracia bacterium]